MSLEFDINDWMPISGYTSYKYSPVIFIKGDHILKDLAISNNYVLNIEIKNTKMKYKKKYIGFLKKPLNINNCENILTKEKTLWGLILNTEWKGLPIDNKGKLIVKI